jgi:hypothetical protein
VIVELTCGGCGDPYTPTRDDLLRGSEWYRKCPECRDGESKSLPAHAYPRASESQQSFTPTRVHQRVVHVPCAARRHDRLPMNPTRRRRRNPSRIGRDRQPAERPMATTTCGSNTAAMKSGGAREPMNAGDDVSGVASGNRTLPQTVAPMLHQAAQKTSPKLSRDHGLFNQRKDASRVNVTRSRRFFARCARQRAGPKDSH